MTLVSLLAMSPIAWQRPPEPEPESEPPRSLETLAIQVLLDRLQFSPGEIDGTEGLNTLNAIDAFERERGRRVRRPADRFHSLRQPSRYTITAADLRTPIVSAIPPRHDGQIQAHTARLHLAPRMFGERFHSRRSC